MEQGFWFHWQIQRCGARAQKLKDRITPHVNNFWRLRLSIEKQEGKRKYKSDGAAVVGGFVCVCLCKVCYFIFIRPLGNTHCLTPVTQKKRSPRDGRACIRPLGSAYFSNCHAKNSTLSYAWNVKEAEAKGQYGVYPTLGNIHCPITATQNTHWVSEQASKWVTAREVSERVCV